MESSTPKNGTIKRGFREYASPMKIPTEWRHLYVGDRIHTSMPFHRIQDANKLLKREGWQFKPEPSPKGYWLLCVASPLVSPHKPEVRAA